MKIEHTDKGCRLIVNEILVHCGDIIDGETQYCSDCQGMREEKEETTNPTIEQIKESVKEPKGDSQ